MSQTKQQIVELQQSIRDLTVVEPIDVQEKLNEMFDIWKRNVSFGQVSEVSEKIRATTIEQIKEPIVDLFHITYSYDYTSICASAFIITLAGVYRLHYNSRGSTDNPSIFICPTMDIYNYSYKWIKVGTIDNSINLKTLRKYIAITSGSTGAITTSDYNRPATGCADKVAEQLIKNMIDIIKE